MKHIARFEISPTSRLRQTANEKPSLPPPPPPRHDCAYLICVNLIGKCARHPFATRFAAQVRAYPSLLDEIASGHCLLFVGAGFAMPAGGPSWASLLQQV